MDFSYPNLLTLAGIHATIISIFMAGATGYFLYLVSRRDELLSAIYDEAERVNSISFGAAIGLPGKGVYVASDNANRRELIERFVCMGMGVPGPGIPRDRKTQGQEALRIISALGNYYPFPQYVEPTPEGGLAHRETKRVEFEDIDDVKKWASEADYLASRLGWLHRVHRAKLLGLLYEATDDLDKGFQERFDPSRFQNSLDPEALQDLQTITSASTRWIVGRFFHNVESIQQIAQSVNEKLVRWESYKRRTSNKVVMLGFVLTNVLVFASGVVYPLTGIQVGLEYVVWVPFFIYGLAFVYLIYRTIRSV